MTVERTYRPILNPAFTPVQSGPNTVNLRVGPFSGPAYTLSDDDETGSLTELPGLLDGTRTVAEIADELDGASEAELRELVGDLAEKGIVFDGNEVEIETADTFGYAKLNPQMSADEFDALADTRVLLVNEGDFGPMVATDLLSVGFSDVRVYDASDGDFDVDGVVVERSTSPLHEHVEWADFVVYLSDGSSLDLVEPVNEHAHETRTPWTQGVVVGYEGNVGPTVVPGRTACHNCYTERVAANVSSTEKYRRFRESSQTGSKNAPLQPFTRVVGGYVTTATVNYVLSGTGFTVGSVLSFDFFDFTVEANDVLRLPRCDVCSSAEVSKRQLADLDTLVEDPDDV